MGDERKVPVIEPDVCELASGERIFIHLFRPKNAPGIGRLFEAIYGPNYPVRRYYSQEELAEGLETGDSYSIVARRESGDIVGHLGLFRSSPYPRLYECGAGLVLPEYRGGGISTLLSSHLYERLGPALGLEEIWGESVCNHVYQQKVVLKHQHVETGLEVDLMPAATYAKEKSSSGRVASVAASRCYIPRPHAVYLPPVYENALRRLYSELDDGRTLAVSGDDPPAGTASEFLLHVYGFAQVARIPFRVIGSDFESCFNGLENKALAGNIKVIQVSLNLACPWVRHAVEVLRGRGFFIGGILPRWFDDDALLMQKIMGRPGWEGIHLFSDRAREILGIVRNDWEEVTSAQTR
jgi:GNAT superfamily N-acetyltransferase